MAQSVVLYATTLPPALALSLGMSRPLLPVDPEVREIAPPSEDEAPLSVEFVGLTAAQARAAISAFPGGRRFRLLSPL